MAKQDATFGKNHSVCVSIDKRRLFENGISGFFAPSFKSSVVVPRYAPRIRSSHF